MNVLNGTVLFKFGVAGCRIESGMSAPESVRGRRGGSPLQVYALRPVTERNCVTVRWGGEQQEGYQNKNRDTKIGTHTN